MSSQADLIIKFIKHKFSSAGTTTAVIAVSGGIDSALSLTLTVMALGCKNVFPVLLPYADQDMRDAKHICAWNQIPAGNIYQHNIKSVADEIFAALSIPASDRLRKGNIMARTRMIFMFDTAKRENALVVGTENKSEHFLGYFTRFGDEASDIEPIAGLYKTQVRQMAQDLGLPQSILTKAPSAGLWQDQTDENELGFSYADADLVLAELIDKGVGKDSIKIPGVSADVVRMVCNRVETQAFKHEVPYKMR